MSPLGLAFADSGSQIGAKSFLGMSALLRYKIHHWDD